MLGDTCLICNVLVPDYVPEMCCNGHECGYYGQPLNPCVCSAECCDALFDFTGADYEQRRINAGIPDRTKKD